MKNYSEQDSSDTEEARIINYNTRKTQNAKHKWQTQWKMTVHFQAQ